MVDIQQLLDLTVREEQYALSAHQNRVAFYSSLISALFAGTVAGALQASATNHYLLLTAGPAIVFALCILGRDGTGRFYRRFREAVSTRAKLEQALGLTLPLEVPDQAEVYWPGESLIPPRYLKARHEQPSSEKFIDSGLRTGYQAVTIRLFLLYQIVASAIAAGLVTLAVIPWLTGR